MATCPSPVPGGSLVSWFDRMERNNVQVVNASLAPGRGARCSTDLGKRLQALANVRSSAVVAIAAGNDGEDLEDVRCSRSKRNLCRNPDNYFGHVLVVGALKNSKKLAGFSNRPGTPASIADRTAVAKIASSTGSWSLLAWG